MEENKSKVGPCSADSPEPTPENAKVFDYNVSQQSRKMPVQKVNPKSPLAAG